MTIDDAMQAAHHYSRGQIEGVISALDGLGVAAHLKHARALQDMAWDDMEQQREHGGPGGSMLRDGGPVAVYLSDTHTVALIREGIRYRLAVRRLIEGWRYAVAGVAGASGAQGWCVTDAADRVTVGDGLPMADLALYGQPLQVADGTLYLESRDEPGRESVRALLLVQDDGGLLLQPPRGAGWQEFPLTV